MINMNHDPFEHVNHPLSVSTNLEYWFENGAAIVYEI